MKMCRDSERYEQVLKDLTNIYGNQKVLFPEDLGDLIGRQIVKSLKENLGIPLPVRKVGKKTGVSIYDVADWIASGNSAIPSTSKKAISQGLPPPKNPRLVSARAIFDLETQINFLEQVRREMLLRYPVPTETFASRTKKIMMDFFSHSKW